jgi:hypothetical protein
VIFSRIEFFAQIDTHDFVVDISTEDIVGPIEEYLPLYQGDDE